MSDNAEQCARAAAEIASHVCTLLGSGMAIDHAGIAAIIAKHFAARAERKFLCVPYVQIASNGASTCPQCNQPIHFSTANAYCVKCNEPVFAGPEWAFATTPGKHWK